VLEGYADTVVDTVGEPLVPSLTQIEEALRRHRVDRGRGGRGFRGLLGAPGEGERGGRNDGHGEAGN